MRLFLIMPLVLLAIGFLLGMARLYRTLIFFICWMLLCSALYVGSMLYGILYQEPGTALMGVAAAVLLALPSIWFATLFSFATSRKLHPTPLMQAQDIYQSLDDSQKRQVQHFAKIGFGFAAKHGSTYLRNKGYIASADALGEAGKSI